VGIELLGVLPGEISMFSIIVVAKQNPRQTVQPPEMFRKPTDKIFSELGGAAALISPQTAFHSAVLLLAALEGAERREDRRYS